MKTTIYYWADGTWCYESALEECLAEGMSDDYEALVIVDDDAYAEDIDAIVNAVLNEGGTSSAQMELALDETILGELEAGDRFKSVADGRTGTVIKQDGPLATDVAWDDVTYVGYEWTVTTSSRKVVQLPPVKGSERVV